MTDTAQGGEAAKREKVAEHDFLGPDGSVVKGIANATGVRYKSAADGATFDYQVPNGTPGDPLSMLAVFGARTLAVNTASAARQARARGEEGVGTDVAEIEARFREIAPGAWGAQREPGAGLGKGIDVDILLDAMESVLQKAGKPFNRANQQQKLLEDPKYRRQVKNVPEFEVEYNKRMVKAGKSKAPSIKDMSFE